MYLVKGLLAWVSMSNLPRTPVSGSRLKPIWTTTVSFTLANVHHATGEETDPPAQPTTTAFRYICQVATQEQTVTVPNRQRTLNELPTELRRGDFVDKAPTEHASRRPDVQKKKRVREVYPTVQKLCRNPFFFNFLAKKAEFGRVYKPKQEFR